MYNKYKSKENLCQLGVRKSLKIMKIELVLRYRTPSLNVTKRQHWTQQFKEKEKAISALRSALLDIASGRLTQITSPEALKTCSTAFAMLASYQATNRGKSSSKLSKSK